MLSSSVNGVKVFDRVLDDLSALDTGGEGYWLAPLSPRSGWMLGASGMHPPITDFVICTKDFGLPQTRHRVIVIGIRRDIAAKLETGKFTAGLLRENSTRTTVEDVLAGMPKLRSGLSRGTDSEAAWRKEVMNAMATVACLTSESASDQAEELRTRALAHRKSLVATGPGLSRTGARPVGIGPDCPDELRTWIRNRNSKQCPITRPEAICRRISPDIFSQPCSEKSWVRHLGRIIFLQRLHRTIEVGQAETSITAFGCNSGTNRRRQ